ncbi:MAG: glycoside hydrolase family 140 protein [Spirosomataceae bacterium]
MGAFPPAQSEETVAFLETRRQQGFNVIQAVALAEFNGIRQPNRYGDIPLVNEDPNQLAITPGSSPANAAEYDYWDHVDFVIQVAAEKGMYIGLLPTWGDKLTRNWGDGPVIFNVTNAKNYGKTLGQRYAKQWNIIWILGGDRPAVYKSREKESNQQIDDRPIWRAMAEGITEGMGKKPFMTYHPPGGANSTSQYIHEEPWLDMNAMQSGHGSRQVKVWDWVARDLALQPQKPTLDMEPCYEDHPVNPWDGKWTRQRGYFNAYDVRARVYRSVFAGACGVTYGHHQIWQFLNTELNPAINIGDTLIGWQRAATAEAATQMQHLKNLLLSRPYFSRIPDQSIIASVEGTDWTDYVVATRDEAGKYALVYLPKNQYVRVDLSKIMGKYRLISWFNPRTGVYTPVSVTKADGIQTFTPSRRARLGTGHRWKRQERDEKAKVATSPKTSMLLRNSPIMPVN